jgi:hypothetical protein
LADLVLYYTECCPEKLAQLKQEGRLWVSFNFFLIYIFIITTVD